jgi:transporter family protein
MRWLLFALLSAIFAAITAILAKIGVENVNSNLATAIRTVIITLFAWSIVFFQKGFNGLSTISRRALIFLVLSGLTTGLSWIFYFRALQLGNASKVVPIDKLSLVLTIIFAALFLSEKVTLTMVLGGILMSVGAIMIAL